MDGTDVVKDYSKPLEIAYLEFFFSSGRIVSSVQTSFFAEGINQNWDENSRFNGIYDQIGNAKTTDFKDVNYTGDLSKFLKGWGTTRRAATETTVEEFPADSGKQFVTGENEAVPGNRNDVADRLKELNLFFGTAAGYQLDNPLTRAQAATIISAGKTLEVPCRNIGGRTMIPLRAFACGAILLLFGAALSIGAKIVEKCLRRSAGFFIIVNIAIEGFPVLSWGFLTAEPQLPHGTLKGEGY